MATTCWQAWGNVSAANCDDNELDGVDEHPVGAFLGRCVVDGFVPRSREQEIGAAPPAGVAGFRPAEGTPCGVDRISHLLE